MIYVASARMYAVTPAALRGFGALFDWLARHSGVPLEAISHTYPAPLADLWSRPDLGCAFMCGFPYMRQAGERPKPVAVPVPARFGGPVYATDFVVRADAPFARLPDTFGHRIGYTVEDSHSGFNAPRHHLLPWRSPERPRLYAESLGPYVTPKRILEALLAGEIDVAPLDGYALDLMLRHDADLRSRIRVVDTTATAPMPFLVAAPGCPDEDVARLRDALLGFGDDPGTARLRETLGLRAFAAVRPEDYELILAWEREALAASYPRPA